MLTIPYLEAGFLLFLLVSVILAWRRVAEPLIPECIEERELGATVILAQLNGVVTGSSIIITGIGVFVALSGDNLEPTAAWNAFYAALWGALALGFALYTFGILPTRTRRENFVRSRIVAISCSVALFFALAAVVRFMFAVKAVVFLSLVKSASLSLSLYA